MIIILELLLKYRKNKNKNYITSDNQSKKFFFLTTLIGDSLIPAGNPYDSKRARP